MITVVASLFGIMNMMAGFQNFGFFTTYFISPSVEVYVCLFSLSALVDSIYPIIFIKLRQSKTIRQQRQLKE